MAKRSSSIRVPDAGNPPRGCRRSSRSRTRRFAWIASFTSACGSAIVSALAVNERLTFYELKKLLQTTDGNLSVHARKLEEAEYITCHKSTDGGVSRTEFRITAAGRRALDKYVAHMEADPRGRKILMPLMTEPAPPLFTDRIGMALAWALLGPAPLSGLPDRRAVPHPIELGRRADGGLLSGACADSRESGAAAAPLR